MVSDSRSISTISVEDFYAGRGYIWRLRGATGGALKIKLVTPAFTKVDRIPMSAINYDGNIDIAVYEGGSATSGGSLVTPLNALRSSTRTSLITCTSGVTYANDGTVLEAWTGTKAQSPNLELWYLKPSTQYVITFSGASNYRIQWAEVYE